MSDGFDFDEHASVELKTERDFMAKNNLLVEFYRQKYKSLNNQNHLAQPDNTQNLNLKFQRAREKIKQEIISSDKSPDNHVLYAAMANFKKRKV